MRFRWVPLCMVLTSFACVTTGKIDQRGFTHKKMGYRLAFKDPASKQFLPPSWSIELDESGQFSPKSQRSFDVKARSLDSDRTLNVRVNEFDLQWKHQKTNGMISLLSLPLDEENATRNLDVILKNYAEALAGQRFVSLGQGPRVEGVSKTFVTDILDSKIRSTAEAEILEADFEVANADQLRLNPQHRLLKYRIFMLRPKSPAQSWVEVSVKGEKQVTERLPGVIAVLYAMDYEYFDAYRGEFAELIGRLSLRPSE